MVASDVGVGDVETPWVDVAPADGTTSAALTVTAPDGATTSIAATGGDLVEIAGTSPTEYSQRWTAVSPVTYSAARKWILHWDVTGTGEGVEDFEVYVVPSPVAGGPAWWPGRSRVAAYVPKRTLVRSVSSTVESADQYAWTFDSTTTPTGLEVSRLISDGANWISARVSPMAAASEPLAGTLVAIFAAAMVERTWPEDDDSLQRANDLEKRLDVMLADLIASNNAANDTGDYGVDIALLPQWSFPQADCRWDSSTYW
jgi:hypothetical protein